MRFLLSSLLFLLLILAWPPPVSNLSSFHNGSISHSPILIPTRLSKRSMTNGNLSIMHDDSFGADWAHSVKKRSVDDENEESGESEDSEESDDKGDTPEIEPTEDTTKPEELTPEQKELREAENNVAKLLKNFNETNTKLEKKKEEAKTANTKYLEAKATWDKLEKMYNESKIAEKARKDWEKAAEADSEAGTTLKNAMDDVDTANSSVVAAEKKLEEVKVEVETLAAFVQEKANCVNLQNRYQQDITDLKIDDKRTAASLARTAKTNADTTVETNRCKGSNAKSSCETDVEAQERADEALTKADSALETAEKDEKAITQAKTDCGTRLTKLNNDIDNLEVSIERGHDQNVQDELRKVSDKKKIMGKKIEKVVTAQKNKNKTAEILEEKKAAKEATEGAGTTVDDDAVRKARLAFDSAKIRKEIVDKKVKKLKETLAKTKGELDQANTTLKTLKQRSKKDEPAMGTTSIVGIGVGALLLVLLVIGGGIGYRFWKKRKDDEQLKTAIEPDPPTAKSTTSTPAVTPVPEPPTYPSQPEPADPVPRVTIPSDKTSFIVGAPITGLEFQAATGTPQWAPSFKDNEKNNQGKSKGFTEDMENKVVGQAGVLNDIDDEITTMEMMPNDEECPTVTGITKSAQAHSIEKVQAIMRKAMFGELKVEDIDDIKYIAAEFSALVAKDDMLLEVDAPAGDSKMWFVGDIHGKMDSLRKILRNMGDPMSTTIKLNMGPNRMVFLGDYVDRGNEQIEVIVCIFCLKVLYPKDVFPLRGNHETWEINGAPHQKRNFLRALRKRFERDPGTKLWLMFTEVFANMSLACVVGQEILCAHGGFSPRLPNMDLKELNNIKKPLQNASRKHIAMEFMWSDVMNWIRGTAMNIFRQCYCVFGFNLVDEMLTANNLKLLIRAHEVMPVGAAIFKNVISIFGCTNANNMNMAASLSIDANRKTTVHTLFDPPGEATREKFDVEYEAKKEGGIKTMEDWRKKELELEEENKKKKEKGKMSHGSGSRSSNSGQKTSSSNSKSSSTESDALKDAGPEGGGQ